MRCECCEAGSLEIRYLPDVIEYEGKTFNAENIPFYVCNSCGSVFVTGETAKARVEYIRLMIHSNEQW